jgi:uncharacterized membrane protein
VTRALPPRQADLQTLRQNWFMVSARTERGLDRIVNFTDAAVAISLTLLVLPLVDIATEVTAKHPLGVVLGDHWANLLAFAISFAVIANMWLIHHRIFEMVGDYDHGLALLNLLWLFTITALPFSTNVIAQNDNTSAILALYLGNIFLASGSALLLRFYLYKHPVLLRADSPGDLHVLAMVIPTAIILVAGILAVLFPNIGALWLLLMFFGTPLERLVVRRQAAHQSASAAAGSK